LTKHYVGVRVMFAWRLFADGKLTVAYLGNFVAQQSCSTKLLNFAACPTWALETCGE